VIHRLKPRKVGSSIGAIFPKNMLTDIPVEEGEELFAVQTLQGFLVEPYNSALEQG
jgi:hypothetical protein